MKYQRVVFNRCNNVNNVNGFARIRKEGDKITMTFKVFNDPKFPDEFEVSINEDMETGIGFLKALGLEPKAQQESYREKWYHPLAHEITFDTIPGIPTYMEVDCESEENLNKLINNLGLDHSMMRFGAFDKQYEEYYGIEREIINDHTPSLTFKNIENELNIVYNKTLLHELQKYYLINNM